MHCGSLIGKITPAQLYNVFVSLEAFVFLAVDKENVLKHPRPYKVCQHGVGQKECKGQGHQGQGQGQNQGLQGQDGEERPCNTVEDLKYRLVRFLIDSADIQGCNSIDIFSSPYLSQDLSPSYVLSFEIYPNLKCPSTQVVPEFAPEVIPDTHPKF